MNLTVLLFSHLKQSFGASSITVEMPDGSTSDELLVEMRSRIPVNLADLQVQIAVNQVYVREAVKLHQGDEIALIPPVQGG